jgi:hypothetical protein
MKSAALPYSPSLSPLLQAQNIASSKWLLITYALGLSKTAAACAAYCMDRFNYKYGRPSYFLPGCFGAVNFGSQIAATGN